MTGEGGNGNEVPAAELRDETTRRRYDSSTTAGVKGLRPLRGGIRRP